MRQVKMRNRFGNPQKAMHIVWLRKHRARDLPGADASFRKQLNDFRLAFADSAKIAIEEFLKVVHRPTMSAMHQRWRETAQARQADQIFRQRWKALGWINWVGREHRVWRDAFKNAVAGNHRAI